jgi:hypothetical protein
MLSFSDSGYLFEDKRSTQIQLVFGSFMYFPASIFALGYANSWLSVHHHVAFFCTEARVFDSTICLRNLIDRTCGRRNGIAELYEHRPIL